MFKVRVYILAVVLAVTLVTVLGRLAYLQIIKGAYYEKKRLDSRQPSTHLATAARGKTTDRFGTPLACDQPSFDLAVRADRLRLSRASFKEIRDLRESFERFRKRKPKPSDARIDAARERLNRAMGSFKDQLTKEAWIRNLASITNRPVPEVGAALASALDKVARGWARTHTPVTFIHRIDRQAWDYLNSRQQDAFRNPALLSRVKRRAMEKLPDDARVTPSFPGLVCVYSNTRIYPYGAFLAHTLGTLGELTPGHIREIRTRQSLVDYRSAREALWSSMRSRFSRRQLVGLHEILGVDARTVEALPSLLDTLKRLNSAQQREAARLGLRDPVRWSNQPPRPERVALCEAEKAWLDTNGTLRVRRSGDAFLVDRLVGETGLERYYNQMLRGKHGLLLKSVPHAKDWQDRREFFPGAHPREGETLVLTIDMAWQQACEEVLEAREVSEPVTPAAMVVMNCRTGEVLAMASYPDFDPNLFVPPRSQAKRLKSVLRDPSKPLVNRCIADRFPLGSVMKPFIAAVALEEQVISPSDTFVCHGTMRVGRRTFACDGRRAHGEVNVVEALRRSCNCFFYRVGMRLGLKRLTPYARALGFGRLTGIDVFGERPGVFPDPHDPGHWTQGDDCLLAIGQGRMAVTPLQATCMVSGMANGGIPVTPRLWLHAPPRIPATRLFSSSSMAVVQQGMEEVVGVGTPGQRGTAHSAFHRDVDPLNVDVAGKTGTADVGSSNQNIQPHAWFAGYAPARNPQVAFCVFVQNGGHGGEVAAPIAYRVLSRIYGTRTRTAAEWRGEVRAEAVPIR